VEALYLQDENKPLIHSTVIYRKSGKLPDAVKDQMPALVATQTRTELKNGEPIRFGGVP